jgi:CheY-like chemotaxis protein
VIIADTPDVCRLLGRVVNRFGYACECSFDGASALDYLAKHKPKLVILDYMMPDMDGMEVLRRIRAEPVTADLCVLILTALTDPAVRDYAMLKGADAFASKSEFSDLENLHAAIDELVCDGGGVAHH